MCNVGAVDRTLLPTEPELGVLLRGLLGICICPKGEVARYEAPCVPDCKTTGGLDGGVTAAVLSESRLTLSEMDIPLLFVDAGILGFLDCAGAGAESLLFSMAGALSRTAAAHSSADRQFFKRSWPMRRGT